MRKHKPGVSKLKKYKKPLFGMGVRKFNKNVLRRNKSKPKKRTKLSRKLCNKRSRKS